MDNGGAHSTQSKPKHVKFVLGPTNQDSSDATSPSSLSSSDDFFQVNPQLLPKLGGAHDKPPRPAGPTTKPFYENDEIDLSNEGSQGSASQFSDTTYESLISSKVSVSVSPVQSPPIFQVMQRAVDFDPERIPPSVFSKSSTPTEWSAASNDSLFSIRIGESSFSRDNVCRVGPESTEQGELLKSPKNIGFGLNSTVSKGIEPYVEIEKTIDVEEPKKNEPTGLVRVEVDRVKREQPRGAALSGRAAVISARVSLAAVVNALHGRRVVIAHRARALSAHRARASIAHHVATVCLGRALSVHHGLAANVRLGRALSVHHGLALSAHRALAANALRVCQTRLLKAQARQRQEASGLAFHVHVVRAGLAHAAVVRSFYLLALTPSPKLKTLLLYSNDLRGVVPYELGKLQNLEVLDVSRYSLGGPLPANLGHCTNLSVLILSTRFSSTHGKMSLGSFRDSNSFEGSFPGEISKLANLNIVSFCSCENIMRQICKQFGKHYATNM
ncbi:leucine-rich repeat receptor-like protein kinase family protein [Striga asiatica]|uniref:Leucine-rich repeat receptor-like protein kinase family protein n=1 Tax=Striga asiatica TaxID=4170 RepID=A0A5A7QEW4_STRAF|nr:leucine-rich repeat receptor-like protein kinase family protein [Striga asiatica]